MLSQYGRREMDRIAARLSALSKKISRVNITATSAQTMSVQSAKRFRIGAFQTIALLSNVTGTVKWSTPMPSADYKVDAACPALANMPAYTVTNQTAEGCTVTFTSPSLLAVGTIVIVLGVSPAS